MTRLIEKASRGAGAGGGMAAVRLTVRGIVQGVGFRPFVHRIARRCGLAGNVANTPGSVVIHLEGEPEAIGRFRALLRGEAPAAARIAAVAARRVRPQGISGFSIRESGRGGETLSTIPPDIALCAACAGELADPADRRFAYPFVNCTGCGPRFTILSRLPYDRENTSMAPFALCARCRAEYEDPADRRFHAEPNACPACGPRVRLADREGREEPGEDPVGEAAFALRSGKIVAVRGLGGFHLAADATDEGAVRRLRAAKGREEKPFAVMAPDLAAARRLARFGPADEAILRSPAAPILLVDARPGSPLAPSVTPGLRQVGLFLPYTPLHRLLLDRTGRPLVMTSGNATDEPIAIGNGEALARLGGIADRFLLHDREIVQRSDDSVVRRLGRRTYPLRRSRGFVPAPVLLPRRGAGRGIADGRGGPGRRGVAGLGGELKNTFCFIKGRFAWLSQHIGDLDHPAAREFYGEAFSFFRRFLDLDLAALCRDLHPAYYTTSFADDVGAARVIPLQHHKAHLYALLAETGFAGKAVGVSFDGTGYGEDGTVWGGEFFAVDGLAMRRAAALAPFPLQGGDSAVKEPWKTALGLLHETYGPDEARRVAAERFPELPEGHAALVLEAIAKGVRVVPTSSCGRLFDGVSALAGVCRKATYEGQPAMLLEGRAGQGTGRGVYNFRVGERDGLLRLDWRGTVAGIVSDLRGGAAPAAVARRFHDTVAAMILAVARRLAREAGASRVLLSGGVFQNVRLLRSLLPAFRREGLKVLVHREVPANDGGISLGQAFYASRILEGEIDDVPRNPRPGH